MNGADEPTSTICGMGITLKLAFGSIANTLFKPANNNITAMIILFIK